MRPLTAKVVDKPLGLVSGMVVGALATAVVRRLWTALTAEDAMPTAGDADSGWSEVLAAAALEGVIFAVAKTTAERLRVAGLRRAVEGRSQLAIR